MKPGYEPIPQIVRDLRDMAKRDGIDLLDAAAREIMGWRRVFALHYAPMLYGDDGELQDHRLPYPIDFARDSFDTIEAQMTSRHLEEMIKAGVAKRVTKPAPDESTA